MDDEVLGVGGTISKHVAEGDDLKVLFVANRVYGHLLDIERLELEEQHARKAQAILGYQHIEFARLPDEEVRTHFVQTIDVLERVAGEFLPDIVYLNHRGDPHQDHRAVFDAALICFRPIAPRVTRARRILCYEVPSSTDQIGPFAEHVFQPNVYVNIEPYLEQKLEAMACYETESREFPHPRSPRGLKALAEARGIRSMLPAAEGFLLVHEEWH